jgi:hypothetical protein
MDWKGFAMMPKNIGIAIAGLCAGLMLSSCQSNPSGPASLALDDTYMTAMIDGVAWSSDRNMGTLFMKGQKSSADTDVWTMKSQLMAQKADGSSLGFMLSTVQADSLPIGAVVSSHTGVYRDETGNYFTRSGYLKLTSLEGDRAEGTFEGEFVAVSGSGVAGKVIKITGGRFLAYAGYAQTGI